jgi:hypothetical protein
VQCYWFQGSVQPADAGVSSRCEVLTEPAQGLHSCGISKRLLMGYVLYFLQWYGAFRCDYQNCASEVLQPVAECVCSMKVFIVVSFRAVMCCMCVWNLPVAAGRST